MLSVKKLGGSAGGSAGGSTGRNEAGKRGWEGAWREANEPITAAQAVSGFTEGSQELPVGHPEHDPDLLGGGMHRRRWRAVGGSHLRSSSSGCRRRCAARSAPPTRSRTSSVTCGASEATSRLGSVTCDGAGHGSRCRTPRRAFIASRDTVTCPCSCPPYVIFRATLTLRRRSPSVPTSRYYSDQIQQPAGQRLVQRVEEEWLPEIDTR